MQLHELKPIHKKKSRKRIGRGGKKGTYSGRGIKGQKARAGRRLKPVIRDLIKRYPKLRGYRQKLKAQNSKFKTTILNLGILEKKLESEEKINPKILLKKRIICRMKGRIPKVKILSQGKLTKKFIIEGCQVSQQAKEKIEKAGGQIR